MPLDLSICKVFPSGAWQLSAIIDNHLMTRTYYFHTKKEAVSMFKQEVKDSTKNS